MRSYARGVLGRRGITGLAATVAVVLAASSAAWACTMIMGITKISNPSNGTWVMIDKQGLKSGPGLKGARGSTVKVMAWELPAGSEFTLWFVWPKSLKNGIGCHEVTDTSGSIMRKPSGALLTNMLADANGSFDGNPSLEGAQAYKAVIPNIAQATTGGTAQICGRENPPFNGQYEAATQHVKLTIL